MGQYLTCKVEAYVNSEKEELSDINIEKFFTLAETSFKLFFLS